MRKLLLVAFLVMLPEMAAAQIPDLGSLLPPGNGSTSGRIVQLMALLTVLSVAPGLLIMMTSFTRFAVALSFLRAGLGLQTTPANLVLISLALFMTFYVMAPTFDRAWETGVQPLMKNEISEEEAFLRISDPFREFMLAHVRQKDLQTFEALVMAGWSSISGTGIHDQRAQTYRVSPIETIKLYSEFKIWTANDYFASSDFVAAMRRQSGVDVTALPRLPMDAGALQIEATMSVSLNGTLRGSAEAGGRGAVVDISGDKIAVVGGVDAAGYRAAGYLVLDAGQLSTLGSESLLLGGTRKQTAGGLEVDAVATSIVIATDGSAATALVAPEILLASEKNIDIVSGSIIEARGSVGGGSGNILIKPAVAAVIDTKGNNDPSDDIVVSPAVDYGAFVRVSNGETVKTVRTGAANTQGTPTIGAASLRGKSIILDATKTTSVAANADLRATALDVSSGRISIGTPSGTPDGLVLSGSSLASLAAASDLHLRSYSSIDFYGNATIGTRSANGEYGLAKLELDAASLNGFTGAQVTIAAGEVLFSNNSGTTATGLGGSGGSLAVNAATIVLGTGAKSVDGFGRVVLDADRAILGRGTGTIDFKSANLAFAAPLLSAESGAQQDWVSTGAFQLTGKFPATEIDTLGARLDDEEHGERIS